MNYNLVVENPESTVVSEYLSEQNKRSVSYQSEADLEKAFIELLQTQAYDYLPITTESDYNRQSSFTTGKTESHSLFSIGMGTILQVDTCQSEQRNP